ncbi:IMS domain-containing protein [Candidatus Synechococcus calcipolaris G9]|uniref:IMS domain-containing protein n=1 Tax=Candidatus Synechococcus calcipolaris G9 TaxID=1497997 RepID=A0ABT6EX10_9SYNE|nr:IMS domain-containing protein [Candidatus Synechococcus calcipolaris]MDG2990019.1 IMS domain-containing protein [Candidatus Synechococcus calcipolaris G9]
MRVPLDCYRILGVPIQATPEQIEAAYGDRLQQSPSPQHSPTTLTTRHELIDQAYAILSEPEQRQAYDRTCQGQRLNPIKTGKTTTAVTQSLGLEIQDKQLPGALLLLYELREFEQVVNLGQVYLRTDISDLRRPYTGTAISEADITLTVALAYLEMGREQWQQKHYEQAAYSLESGLGVLRPSSFFPELQQQFQSELDRLRPYRILELLSLPLTEEDSRERGLMLLKDMLGDRGGIDGRHDDRSGLEVEDFLKFIQQLRAYLTAAEQQELFERESRRPSAVASYLAVYALIARGFAESQPGFIRRAKGLLQRLLPQQDIYLELASCTLLLGQPQEALEVLDQSKDHHAIQFIYKYSRDAPDALPGLYHYTEQWLQQDVYPSFRDLGTMPVSLDAYFADPKIQAYLEALVAESEQPLTSSPAVSTLAAPSHYPQSVASTEVAAAPQPVADPWENRPSPGQSSRQSFVSPPLTAPTTSTTVNPWEFPKIAQPLESPQPSYHQVNSGSTPAPIESPTGSEYPTSHSISAGPTEAPPRRSPRKESPGKSPLPKPSSSSNAQRWPWLAFALGSVIVVLGLGMGAHHVMTREQPSEVPEPIPPETEVESFPLPVATTIPPEVSPSPTPEATLTEAIARDRLRTWQKMKSLALGSEYQTQGLESILAEPTLSRWQDSSRQNQSAKTHWQYKRQDVEITEVRSLAPDRVEVVAKVEEEANLYQNGQPRNDGSYIDSYQVRYIFVRQNDQWLIQDMRVIS